MATKNTRKPRTPPPQASTIPDEEFELPVTQVDKPAEQTSAKAPIRKARSQTLATATSETVAPSADQHKHGVRPMVTHAYTDQRNLKNLSKTQKQKLESWKGDQRGRKVDVLFKSTMEANRREYGHSSVMVAHPGEVLSIGIPCPFPWEYLTGQSALVLGLVLQIVGPPGTCKSPLLFDIFRWFRDAGGGSHLMEAETKWSPTLLRSIVRFGTTEHNVIISKCHTVEDWQQKLLFNMEQDKRMMVGTKEEPGPGKTIPICFGVDSVVGKMSRETQEKILAQGFHGRSHPIEALSISGYMKAVAGQLDNWPFAIVLINHLKFGTDQNGHEVRRVGGGSTLNFQESFELETAIRKSQISCMDWTGTQISLRCRKDSLAETHRSIDTRLLWWNEEDPELKERVQISCWDWDWSTVHTLLNLKGAKAALLQEAGFHLAAPKISDVENSAWSKNLGMKAEDAAPWSEVGRKLTNDPKIRDLLRDCLDIKRVPFLEGDYLKQLEAMRQQMT